MAFRSLSNARNPDSIWVMPGRLTVKENEMKYSLGPKADCNQANLTDEKVCPNLLIPSSIFLAVLADGCL